MPSFDQLSFAERKGVAQTELQECGSSPYRARNRNTKNLFLKIGNSPVQKLAQGSTQDEFDSEATSQTSLRDPVAIASRKQTARNEAHIFSLSSVLDKAKISPVSSKGSSGVQSTADIGGTRSRIKRKMSSPLQLKTSSVSSNSTDGLTTPIELQSLSLEQNTDSAHHTTSWVYHKKSASASPSSSNDDNGFYKYHEEYKGNAYPQGPLLVHGSMLYLCSEPTFEELQDYDVTINVAQEVKSFRSQLPVEKQGYYHHIEWTHTAKICPDLPRLTQLIHQAVRSGQKVLVHCQCGVSRSASLIVAYIMRYEELSLNDAYNHLKAVAKDISPNMSLIFQLMEWNEALTTHRLHTQTENAGTGQNGSPSQDENKPDLKPWEIANILSQQTADELAKAFLSSPNSSSISTENTPRTPRELPNYSQVPYKPSLTGKSANCFGAPVAGSSQYYSLFDSLSPSLVQLGEKDGSTWN
ncbi:LADA_0E10286g1_1 [Lachancea dasiensis]|uniref:protein-tyrosine-phosphatase n=1 Tax=Lachancea dasiensis TaxID=1072105 RepID=A0A1G4JE29_9SACH|nr:LADA_0E10286g1_1 [Lachancea dasiensis]